MSLTGPAFPRLTPANHRVTSPATIDYNCVAWAAGDTSRWWQPDVFWPAPASASACDLPTLIDAFREIGFELCDDLSLEPDFEKIALYGDSTYYLHAAKQLANGNWSSKLGADVDIEHDTVDDIAHGAYGTVKHFMKRKRHAPPTPA